MNPSQNVLKRPSWALTQAEKRQHHWLMAGLGLLTVTLILTQAERQQHHGLMAATTTTTTVLNISFLSPSLSGIWRGPKIQCGGCWSPRRSLANKFLHGALLPTYTYQHTKYRLPSSTSLEVKIKSAGGCGLLILQMPPSRQILTWSPSTYQSIKYQLSSSITFGDTKGVPTIKSRGCWSPRCP